MKLAATQVLLGVLVVLAACYIVGWMVFVTPDFLSKELIADSGETEIVSLVVSNGALFDVARFFPGWCSG